jgi:hypothetical protein
MPTFHCQLLVRALFAAIIALVQGNSNSNYNINGNNNNNNNNNNSTYHQYLNIYGNALESCSQKNMALTGYERTGLCVEKTDDEGAHHICIDLSSTTSSRGNFCTVTGQSDLCSSYMPCDTTSSNLGGDDHDDTNGDKSSDTCPVEDWCLCQWAFAYYLKKVGGCDYIQAVKCEAINMEALFAYSHLAGGYKDYDGKYTNALDCLLHQCNVSDEVLAQYQYATSRKQKRSGSVTFLTDVMWMISIVSVACLFIFKLFKKKGKLTSDVAKTNILKNNYQTIP